MKKASNWRQAMLANYRIGVSAHRGASQVAPENTLATFKQVLAMQVDYIEIDVRTSLDGQLMILHDGQLNRTTTGTGPLKDKTAAELKQLSAGKGYGDAYAAEQIPTLAEVCALLADWNARHKHQTHLYVDCKDVDPKPLVEILSSYGQLKNAVFYGSDAMLLALKQVAPTAKLMPGLRSEAELSDKIQKLKPYAFDVRWQALSESLIRQIHQQGILVFSDALDYFESTDQYKKAAAFGIDVIQTDFVLRVYETLAMKKD